MATGSAPRRMISAGRRAGQDHVRATTRRAKSAWRKRIRSGIDKPRPLTLCHDRQQLLELRGRRLGVHAGVLVRIRRLVPPRGRCPRQPARCLYLARLPLRDILPQPVDVLP
jgi:hypothetical protein